MNCLTRSLDLLHEKGGWFAARASVHSGWGMHAIHIDRDGRVASYVPPEPLLYNPGTLRDLNQYLNEVVR